jgi:hypothetical protein
MLGPPSLSSNWQPLHGIESALKAETPYSRNSFEQRVNMWLRHLSGISIFAVSEFIAGLKGGINILEVYDALQRQVAAHMTQLAIPETAKLRETVCLLQFITYCDVRLKTQSDDDPAQRPLKVHSGDNQRYRRVVVHPRPDLGCVLFGAVADEEHTPEVPRVVRVPVRMPT